MPQTGKIAAGGGSADRSGLSVREVPSGSSADRAATDVRLFEFLEDLTRRIEAGEPVDLEVVASEHPAWADDIRELLPALQGLADLGLETRGDGNSQGDDPYSRAGKAYGDFRIVREIGRGGMGVVYEAEQVALGRRVALKVLPLAAAMDPRALQRFQLEAQVAGWLQHPAHRAGASPSGTVDDVPYFAMQFIEGGSLADLIAELRGLDRPGTGSSAASTDRRCTQHARGRAPLGPVRPTAPRARSGAGPRRPPIRRRCRPAPALDLVDPQPGLSPDGRPAGHPGGRGARLRPRPGDRPPRRQAGQPAAGPPRRPLGRRLRHGRRPGRRRADADRRPARHAAVHEPRAGRRAAAPWSIAGPTSTRWARRSTSC